MKKIEVKAISEELALKRAMKILEACEETHIFDIVEIIKPKKKLFGLLGTSMGLYEISARLKSEKAEIKKEEIKTETKNKDLEKKNQVKEKEEKNIKEDKNQKFDKNIKKEIKTEIKESKIKEEVKQDSNFENKIAEITEKANYMLEIMDLRLKAHTKKVKEKQYLVDLVGDDNAIIIGKKGKTLNSFEYLLNCIVKDCRIEVDVEGFKEKRNETLRDLAKKMSIKALKTHRTIKLNPMPPRERKIIHEVVNQFNELDTYSEGRDPKRYIVIKKKHK